MSGVQGKHYDTGFRLDEAIEEGTPATMSVGSDRYAMVVTAVTKSGKTITIAHAEQDEFGSWVVDTKRKERIKVRESKTPGQWRTIGSSYRKPVFFGRAENYRDPSF